MLPLCLSGVPGPQIHSGDWGPCPECVLQEKRGGNILNRRHKGEKRASKFEDCLLKVLQGALASL